MTVGFAKVSLMGEGSKPVPVPDTGAEGEINAPAHVTDCTRNNHPNQSSLHMPIHIKSPMKRGDAVPYLSMPVPPPCGYCLEASMTAPSTPSFPRRRESIGKCNLRYLQSAPDIAVPMSFAKVSIKGEIGCLVVTPPCGYCLEASMTVSGAPGMTVKGATMATGFTKGVSVSRRLRLLCS